VDYAQLLKTYAEPTGQKVHRRKYSPSERTVAKKRYVEGNPVMAQVSRSHAERQNLTMRMHMRRFTRQNNIFSGKIENHAYAEARHFIYYNV
jgi:IS1 family transposase